MPQQPDTALVVALDQRQRALDEQRLELSRHNRLLQERTEALRQAQSRVQMVLLQMDAAQRPVSGVDLPIAMLGELEHMLDWCQVQVLVQAERCAQAGAATDQARGAVAVAHQQVRALELVLAARALDRVRKLQRAEIVLADETAARVHARNAVLR